MQIDSNYSYDYIKRFQGVNVIDNKPNMEHKPWHHQCSNGKYDVLLCGYTDIETLRQRPEYEKYLVVIHNEGDTLPDDYIKVAGALPDGKIAARYDGLVGMMVHAGGMQLVSKLSNDRFLLGPGPEIMDMKAKTVEAIEEYIATKEKTDPPPAIVPNM